MTDTAYLLLAALLLLTLLLQTALLLRKPRFDTPPDLQARLALVEQQLQALTQAQAQAGTLAQSAAARSDQQLRQLNDTTAAALQGQRQALDAQLARTVDEARHGRQELLTHLAQAQADAAKSRAETQQVLAVFRTEMAGTLGTLSNETVKSRTALADSATAFEQRIQERFEVLGNATRGTLDALKADIHNQLGSMAGAVNTQLQANGEQLRHQFATLHDGMGQQLRGMAQGSAHSAEQLRAAMNERLAAIQQDNTAKLEEMRRTVDDKLHATLEQRLGDSFKLVSERLEQVHAGLGEMKTLAGSVGDLKRVMSNVRTRGTWGEVQLGAIIENLLTAEQFDRNVKTVPGSNELVEFAVRMPGRGDDVPVWLPIDSKYPVEHYQRLLDAHETLDKAVVQQALSAFESSLRLEARKIAAKYLSPPHTTDFAILFLPTEGLFAEAARAPGLMEALQNDHRVVVAGPTTLAAVLSSLRLGFRTLAIEKRSSEVWGILSSVKSEFQKFGDIVDSTKKSIDAAAKKFDDLGVRTRAIKRRLVDVHELPAGSAPLALAGVPPLSETGFGDGLDDEDVA